MCIFFILIWTIAYLAFTGICQWGSFNDKTLVILAEELKP